MHSINITKYYYHIGNSPFRKKNGLANNELIQFTNKYDQQFLDYQELKYPTSGMTGGHLGLAEGIYFYILWGSPKRQKE